MRRVFLLAFISCAVPSLQSQEVPVYGCTPQALAVTNGVRRKWQFGAYGEGGFAYDYHVGNFSIVRYRKEQEFYAITLQGGRMLTGLHGPRALRGRFETLAELTPFWLTHSPKQENKLYSSTPDSIFNGAVGDFASYSVHGVSVTPFIPRWNFEHSEAQRVVPWFDVGMGVLWTTNRFPQGNGLLGKTSRINFSPQAAIGTDIFVKKTQSLNVGMRVSGYTSFNLGEYDPGVPWTFNFSVGYSWWR